MKSNRHRVLALQPGHVEITIAGHFQCFMALRASGLQFDLRRTQTQHSGATRMAQTQKNDSIVVGGDGQ
jgi:hypothetical protein